MSDQHLEKLKNIEKNQRDLFTKYNVLVKRTNSIITTLNQINEKLDYLVETMSMFELMEDSAEEDEDDYESYSSEYTEDEDEDEDEEDE